MTATLPPVIHAETVALLAIDLDRARRNTLGRLASLGLLGSALTTIAGCAYRNIPGFQFTPALFEVKIPSSEATTYLFGSVHAGLSRFYPLPSKIENCISQSTVLAVEVDMQVRLAEATALFRPHVRLQSNTSLSRIIGDDQFTAMARHFGWFVQEKATYERYAPWFVAINLLSEDDKKMGLERAIGLESVLLTQAKNQNKQILELEQVSEQVDAFVNGSIEEQREHLLMRFDQVKRWDSTTQDLVDAWRLGDLEALEKVKARNFGSKTKLQSLRNRLFTDRDDRMASRLITFMRSSNKVCFAAVGALHLAGDDGLQHRLAELGAKVSRLVY
jgi:uncharacterized protein